MKRTRQALERAFAALVAEKGLATLGLRELAKRAGVNRATFYAHFVEPN